MIGERPLIVVAEDDEEINSLQCELLSLYGIDALPTYSGKGALEVCRANEPDAVLLDVMLPEMDGFEACRQIRRFACDLPVVIITALDSEECRRRCREAGADAYIAKPFNPDDVIQKILELIDGAPSSGGD
jgi:DNA-binding response OmpR family regulator